MITSPIESTSILSIPLGPKVDLTASAIAFAAAILFCVAFLPLSLCVPSFKITTGEFPGNIFYPNYSEESNI